jgi:hypothetical protein
MIVQGKQTVELKYSGGFGRLMDDFIQRRLEQSDEMLKNVSVPAFD